MDNEANAIRKQFGLYLIYHPEMVFTPEIVLALPLFREDAPITCMTQSGHPCKKSKTVKSRLVTT